VKYESRTDGAFRVPARSFLWLWKPKIIPHPPLLTKPCPCLSGTIALDKSERVGPRWIEYPAGFFVVGGLVVPECRGDWEFVLCLVVHTFSSAGERKGITERFRGY